MQQQMRSKMPISRLTMTAYRNDSSIAASDLKLLLQKSPYHFSRRHDLPNTESPSLSFGTAMHYAILEPEHYESCKEIEPTLRRNTNAYKAWRESLPDEAIVVSAEFDEQVQQVKDRLVETGLSSLFAQGEPELSVFAEVQGVKLKCRPDWLDLQNRRIIDLKTTRDLKWFGADARKLCYGLSAVHYKEILAHETKTQPSDWEYVFVCVENQAPFDTDWYILSKETEARSQAQWQDGIDLYQNCAASGRWAGLCTDEPKEF